MHKKLIDKNVKIINSIGEKIGSVKLSSNEIETLFNLSSAGYFEASYYYGLCLLLNFNNEMLAIEWIKGDKTIPLHRKFQ